MEVLTDLKSLLQCSCLSSLGTKRCFPNCFLRLPTRALHLPRRYRLVSYSSPQRGHIGSSVIFVRSDGHKVWESDNEQCGLHLEWVHFWCFCRLHWELDFLIVYLLIPSRTRASRRISPSRQVCIAVQVSEKSAQKHEHCALAIVRLSQKISPRCRPPSRGCRTAKF